VHRHLGALRQCKRTAGDDLRSFWILLKLDKDGTVKEVLLYPATKVGTCEREALLKDRFTSPPRPAYWIGVFMKMAQLTSPKRWLCITFLRPRCAAGFARPDTDLSGLGLSFPLSGG